MLTAVYTINLLAPVVGDRLVTRAVVVSAGQRLITARCELIEPHPEHDRVCAIAQGTIARTGRWRPAPETAGWPADWPSTLQVDTTGRPGR